MDRAIPGHITGLYIFTIFNLLALFHITLVSGEIIVTDTVKNITVATYDDMPALFGSSLPMDGLSGVLVYVHPHNACTTVEKPPRDAQPQRRWIALIAREGCDFALKVYNVQKAGYHLAMVFNVRGSDALVQMGGDGREVHIPSVFVGYSTGMDMADNFDYKKKNILLTVDGDIPLPNYKIYLWPFAIVVGTCFCLMLVFMIGKWCRDRRRRNRSRLSTKHLKKIPIKKYKKGDNYDVCAICLDDYIEGEKLRLLPCSHTYHRKCIDPWLTKNRKTCPICKRRVIPGEENESETDSDAEGGSTSQSEATERTPLLGSQSDTSRQSRTSSTFGSSGLPETVRNQVQTVRHNDEDSDSVSSLEGAVGGAVVHIENRQLDNIPQDVVDEDTQTPTTSTSCPARTTASSPAEIHQPSSSKTNQMLLSKVKKSKPKSKKSSKNMEEEIKPILGSASSDDSYNVSDNPFIQASRGNNSSPFRKENSSPVPKEDNSPSGRNNPGFEEEEEVSFNKDTKVDKTSHVV